MANVKTGDPAVDTFLKGYAPPVREIAVKAREAIFSVFPGATEKVYPGWKVIQYGAGADMKSVFAAISHSASGATWGSPTARDLPAPKGWLEAAARLIAPANWTRPGRPAPRPAKS